MSSGKVEVRYVDTSDVVHVYTFIFLYGAWSN